jgi:hypothetical protein
MLSPENFAEIQQALVIVYGQWVLWGLAFMIGGSVLISIGVIFFGLLRRLVKGG